MKLAAGVNRHFLRNILASLKKFWECRGNQGKSGKSVKLYRKAQGSLNIHGALEGGREVARGHVFEGEVEVTYFEICEVRQNFPKICEVSSTTRSRLISKLSAKSRMKHY